MRRVAEEEKLKSQRREERAAKKRAREEAREEKQRGAMARKEAKAEKSRREAAAAGARAAKRAAKAAEAGEKAAEREAERVQAASRCARVKKVSQGGTAKRKPSMGKGKVQESGASLGQGRGWVKAAYQEEGSSRDSWRRWCADWVPVEVVSREVPFKVIKAAVLTKRLLWVLE